MAGILHSWDCEYLDANWQVSERDIEEKGTLLLGEELWVDSYLNFCDHLAPIVKLRGRMLNWNGICIF